MAPRKTKVDNNANAQGDELGDLVKLDDEGQMENGKFILIILFIF